MSRQRPARPVVGYLHAGGAHADQTAASLEDQRRVIRAAADARRWQPVELVTEVTDGSSWAARPGLAAALTAVRVGEANTLVAARLSCLCRSIPEAARLLETARRQGWNLVVLDLGIDLSTDEGMTMAAMTAVFAELEHRLRGDRARTAMVRGRARGARLGRPPAVPALLRQRIRQERAAGRSLRIIAAALNRDSVATAHGGRHWHASTVRAVANAAAVGGPRSAASAARD